jgi:hypothetical protein
MHHNKHLFRNGAKQAQHFSISSRYRNLGNVQYGKYGTQLRAAFSVFAPSSRIFLRYRGNGIGVSGHSPDKLFEANWHD